MDRLHKVFGMTCEKCPLCRYARAHPEGKVYKMLDSPIHGDNCPAWQGYKMLEEERASKGQQSE